MNKLSTKRLTAMLMIFFQLSLAVFSTVPRLALAQEADIDPPIIEFEAITSGNRVDSQVFAATVFDDVLVESVKLYYRFEENSAYLSRTMKMLGSTGIFTITLGSEEVPPSASFIQYYLEAADGVGNRSLQGFAFDPLERQLVSVTELAEAPQTESVATEGMSLNRKILFGALGVLVLGALASSSGGGGAAAAPGVPVTVVVDQLP